MFNSKKTAQVDFALFTIYDSKTQSYRPPTVAVNDQDILRGIYNEFEQSKEKNGMYANAEDYALYKIGQFNQKTGQLESHDPLHVVNFHEIRSAIQAKDPVANSADLTKIYGELTELRSLLAQAQAMGITKESEGFDNVPNLPKI